MASEYVITYAVTRGYGLDIETVSFAAESDARVALASLRKLCGLRRVISATLEDPCGHVIAEFEQGI